MEKEILIKKWLQGELTDAEKKAFTQLEDSQLNQAILENAVYFKASHFSEMEGFDSFKEKYRSQKKTIKKLHWASPFLKIASVLAIVFGLYFALFHNTLTHIETAAGEKTAIELPDHSQVLLNAVSSIEYHKSNWDDKRWIKLEGEAYFKVAKGKTFEVVTKSGTITVVGTQFNVRQRENYFEVKCFEGLVNVLSDTIKRDLRAGETFRILNNKFSEGNTIATLPAWTDNMSDFDAVPVNEVLAELERQYSIKIISENINTNRLFTGGFVHDNLENALISITQPMNMTYELSSSKQVVIRGKSK